MLAIKSLAISAVPLPNGLAPRIDLSPNYEDSIKCHCSRKIAPLVFFLVDVYRIIFLGLDAVKIIIIS